MKCLMINDHSYNTKQSKDAPLKKKNGATTFSIMALCLKTLSIDLLSIKTLSIMAYSTTTIRLMALVIKSFSIMAEHNDM